MAKALTDDFQSSLEQLVAGEIGRGGVRETVLCLARAGQTACAASGTWQGSPVDADTPFLLASTSKLFVTAMILRLASDRALSLDDPVVRFFPDGALDGLHRWRGRDRTDAITLYHLLTHSSGLPDYFEGKRRHGPRLADALFAGQDRSYGLDDVIAWTRDEMTPAFPPGAGRRALYSDTNFYLLTEIVARVAGLDPDAALERFVTGPLGLTATGLFRPGTAALPLRLGDKVVDIPHALAAMPGDGGAVSTAREMMSFLQAFLGGRLFAPRFLDRLADWRRVFFPLQAGLGVLRFRHPAFLPPFRRGLDFIGHSGICGAFAFACPARDLFLTGTVNQLQNRSRPYRLMIRAALAAG
jgi:D-alanyl-D-alanine carboxypeptidase